MSTNPVAYAIAAGQQDWTAGFRLANRLVRSGHRVLVVTEPTAGGPVPGTFVVPLSAAFDPGFASGLTAAGLEQAAREAGATITPIARAARIIAAPMRAIRLGLYGGGGAPYNHASILASCGFQIRFISDAQVRAGALAEIDVFVMPGGGERAMMGQIDPLGEAGATAIADFVRAGGMYIGCCAGSYDCIINTDEFYGICPAQRCLQLLNAGSWRGDAAQVLGLQSPGVGVLTVHNETPGHPVMFGMPADFELVHYNGPVLNPTATPMIENSSLATPLARFTGWTDRFTLAEEFPGPRADTSKPVYLAQAIAAGRFAIAAGELGVGRVVAFGSHPEFGFDLPMVEWTHPARMFANAALWQAWATPRVSAPAAPVQARVGLPAGSALAEIAPAAAAVRDAVATLATKSIDPQPMWLAGAYSMSVFGLTPAAIWTQTLADLGRLLDDIEAAANRLHQGIGAIPPAMLQQIDQWVLDERDPAWLQDGGYQGVRALLRIADRMCRQALAQWDVTLGPPLGAYDYFSENPFHQVAGSYLAAIGCVGGALQLMRALEAEADTRRWLAAAPAAN
jgi:hypothetical protein